MSAVLCNCERYYGRNFCTFSEYTCGIFIQKSRFFCTPTYSLCIQLSYVFLVYLLLWALLRVSWFLWPLLRKVYHKHNRKIEVYWTEATYIFCRGHKLHWCLHPIKNGNSNFSHSLVRIKLCFFAIKHHCKVKYLHSQIRRLYKAEGEAVSLWFFLSHLILQGRINE